MAFLVSSVPRCTESVAIHCRDFIPLVIFGWQESEECQKETNLLSPRIDLLPRMSLSFQSCTSRLIKGTMIDVIIKEKDSDWMDEVLNLLLRLERMGFDW